MAYTEEDAPNYQPPEETPPPPPPANPDWTPDFSAPDENAMYGQGPPQEAPPPPPPAAPPPEWTAPEAPPAEEAPDTSAPEPPKLWTPDYSRPDENALYGQVPYVQSAGEYNEQLKQQAYQSQVYTRGMKYANDLTEAALKAEMEKDPTFGDFNAYLDTKGIKPWTDDPTSQQDSFATWVASGGSGNVDDYLKSIQDHYTEFNDRIAATATQAYNDASSQYARTLDEYYKPQQEAKAKRDLEIQAANDLPTAYERQQRLSELGVVDASGRLIKPPESDWSIGRIPGILEGTARSFGQTGNPLDLLGGAAHSAMLLGQTTGELGASAVGAYLENLRKYGPSLSPFGIVPSSVDIETAIRGAREGRINPGSLVLGIPEAERLATSQDWMDRAKLAGVGLAAAIATDPLSYLGGLGIAGRVASKAAAAQRLFVLDRVGTDGAKAAATAIRAGARLDSSAALDRALFQSGVAVGNPIIQAFSRSPVGVQKAVSMAMVPVNFINDIQQLPMIYVERLTGVPMSALFLPVVAAPVVLAALPPEWVAGTGVDPSGLMIGGGLASGLLLGAAVGFGYRYGLPGLARVLPKALGSPSVGMVVKAGGTGTPTLLRRLPEAVYAEGGKVYDIKGTAIYTLKPGESYVSPGTTVRLPRNLVELNRAAYGEVRGDLVTGLMQSIRSRVEGADKPMEVLQEILTRVLPISPERLAKDAPDAVRDIKLAEGKTLGDVSELFTDIKLQSGWGDLRKVIRDQAGAKNAQEIRNWFAQYEKVWGDDPSKLLDHVGTLASYSIAKELKTGIAGNPMQKSFTISANFYSLDPEARTKILNAIPDARLRERVAAQYDPENANWHKFGLGKQMSDMTEKGRSALGKLHNEGIFREASKLNDEVMAAAKRAGIDSARLTTMDPDTWTPKINAWYEVMRGTKALLSPYWLLMRPGYHVNNFLGDALAISAMQGLGAWRYAGRDYRIQQRVRRGGEGLREGTPWTRRSQQQSEFETGSSKQPGIAEYLASSTQAGGAVRKSQAIFAPGRAIARGVETLTSAVPLLTEHDRRDLAFTVEYVRQFDEKLRKDTYEQARSAGFTHGEAVALSKGLVNRVATGELDPASWKDHWFDSVDWSALGKYADQYREEAAKFATPEEYFKELELSRAKLLATIADDNRPDMPGDYSRLRVEKKLLEVYPREQVSAALAVVDRMGAYYAAKSADPAATYKDFYKDLFGRIVTGTDATKLMQELMDNGNRVGFSLRPEDTGELDRYKALYQLRVPNKYFLDTMERSAGERFKTIRQWAENRETPLDENGHPIVFFHGSNRDWEGTAFSRTNDLGYHFGTYQAAYDRLRQFSFESNPITPGPAASPEALARTLRAVPEPGPDGVFPVSVRERPGGPRVFVHSRDYGATRKEHLVVPEIAPGFIPEGAIRGTTDIDEARRLIAQHLAVLEEASSAPRLTDIHARLRPPGPEDASAFADHDPYGVFFSSRESLYDPQTRIQAIPILGMANDLRGVSLRFVDRDSPLLQLRPAGAGPVPMEAWRGATASAISYLDLAGSPGEWLGAVPDSGHIGSYYLHVKNPALLADQVTWRNFDGMADEIVRLNHLDPDDQAVKDFVRRVSELSDPRLPELIRLDSRWTLAEFKSKKFVGALKLLGFDSIAYKNGAEDPGSYSYIIFDSAQAKSTHSGNPIDPTSPDVLWAKSQERGVATALGATYRDPATGRFVMMLGEKPHIGTLMHEMFHVFRLGLPEGAVPEAVRKAVGVTGNNWTTAAEERLAYAFERYMRSGVAPVPELKTIFAKFRTWLTEVYKTIQHIVTRYTEGGEVKSEPTRLHPDVKAWFDEVLSTAPEPGLKDYIFAQRGPDPPKPAFAPTDIPALRAAFEAAVKAERENKNPRLSKLLASKRRTAETQLDRAMSGQKKIDALKSPDSPQAVIDALVREGVIDPKHLEPGTETPYDPNILSAHLTRIKSVQDLYGVALKKFEDAVTTNNEAEATRLFDKLRWYEKVMNERQAELRAAYPTHLTDADAAAIASRLGLEHAAGSIPSTRETVRKTLEAHADKIRTLVGEADPLGLSWAAYRDKFTPQVIRNLRGNADQYARLEGEDRAKAILFPYGSDRTYLDYMMDHVFPYHYWFDRHVLQMSRYLATHPLQYAGILWAYDQWKKQTEDLPQSYKWTVHLFDLPNGTQVRFRPSSFSPFLGGSLIDIQSPETVTRTLSRNGIWGGVADLLGYTPYPAISMLADYAQTKGLSSPFAQTRPGEDRARDLISLLTLARQFSGGRVDVEGPLRQLIYGTSAVGPEVYATTLELFRRIDEAKTPQEREQRTINATAAILAYREGTPNALWEDAKQAALLGLGTAALARFMGAPISLFTPERMQYEQANQQFRNLKGDALPTKDFFKDFPGMGVVWGRRDTPQELRNSLTTESYYLQLQNISDKYKAEYTAISNAWANGEITGRVWKARDKALDEAKSAEIDALKKYVRDQWGGEVAPGKPAKYAPDFSIQVQNEGDPGLLARPLSNEDAFKVYGDISPDKFMTEEGVPNFAAWKQAQQDFLDTLAKPMRDAVIENSKKNWTEADRWYYTQVAPAFEAIQKVPKYTGEFTPDQAKRWDDIKSTYSSARYPAEGKDLGNVAGIRALAAKGYTNSDYSEARNRTNPEYQKVWDSPVAAPAREYSSGKAAPKAAGPKPVTTRQSTGGQAVSGSLPEPYSLRTVSGEPFTANDYRTTYDALKAAGRNDEAWYLFALNYDALKTAGWRLRGDKPDVKVAKLKYEQDLLFRDMPPKGSARDEWYAKGNGKKLNDISRALGEKPLAPEWTPEQLSAIQRRNQIFDTANKLPAAERARFLAASGPELDRLSAIAKGQAPPSASAPRPYTPPAPSRGGGGGGGGSGGRPAPKPVQDSPDKIQAKPFASDAGPGLVDSVRKYLRGQRPLSALELQLLARLRVKYPLAVAPDSDYRVWLGALGRLLVWV